MKITFATLFFLCLLACGTSFDEKYLESTTAARKNLISLKFEKELKLPVPSNSIGLASNSFLYRNKYLLVSSSKKPHLINIYDLEKNSIIKQFEIDKNFIPQPGSFYVHNFDSIFITHRMPPQISLIDSSGAVKLTMDLSYAPVNWKTPNGSGEYIFADFAHNRPFFDAKDKNLYLTLNDVDIWWYTNRNEHNTSGIFNISNLEWKLVFGEYPDIVTKSGKVMYPYFLSQPHQLVTDEYVFTAFPIDHLIRKYDKKSGKLIESKSIDSKYIKKIAAPIDYFSSEENPQLRRNLIIETGYYGGIYYHEDLKIYSRLALHSQDLKLPDGRLNSPTNKISSIIFFDENLNILGEYKFTDEFGPYGGEIIPLSDGIIAAKTNQDSDDYLNFSGLFKIINED